MQSLTTGGDRHQGFSRPRHMSRVIRGAAIATALLTAGCTRETIEDDAVVYTLEWWVSALVVLGILAAIAVWPVVRERRWKAVLAMIAVMLFCVAPASMMDYVRVDSAGFQVHSGFWFAPTVHQVSFNEVEQVTLRTKARRGGRRYRRSFRRSLRPRCIMVVEKKDGSSEEIVISSTLVKAAAERIGQKLAENRIVVINQIPSGSEFQPVIEAIDPIGRGMASQFKARR
jgi:hypothetical protein